MLARALSRSLKLSFITTRSVDSAQACLIREFVLDSQSSSNPPPKRPVSGWLRYLQEQRQQTHLDEGTKATTFSKLVAEKWKSLPEAQKQSYKDAYRAEYRKYEEQLTEVDKLQMSQQRKERREAKQKRIKRRESKLHEQKLREMGKPKKPMTSFLLYLESLDSGDDSPTVFVKGASQRYRQLPADDLQEFERQYAALKATYDEQYKTWLTRMFEQGNGLMLSKKEIEDYFNRPRKPRGAKYIYVNEEFSRQMSPDAPEAEVKALKTKLMKEFEGLSNAKKAGYAEKFKAEMTSFQSKHENFLKQMEKHGLDHLFAPKPKPVRKKVKAVVKRKTKKVKKAKVKAMKKTSVKKATSKSTSKAAMRASEQ